MMKLLKLREAADVARVALPTLRKQIAAGRGPATTRLGSDRGSMLISETALAEWITSRTAPPGGAA